MTNLNTIDEKEVAKFAAMADDWWNPNGKFRPLHKFNPTRLKFIRDNIIEHFKINNQTKPLEGLKLLDIGCGGGLLSEPMARLGAKVTGIDATEKNIKTASAHIINSDINIDYRHTSAEELLKTHNGAFDIVLNMEVIEHVNHPQDFLRTSMQLLSPNGIMFIATINRTFKARALALFAAENILKWLPPGTHDYDKLIKPQEIMPILKEDKSINIDGPIGVSYNPISDKFSLSEDISMNYMIVFKR
ncbi:MAG: bifunctional 2-polyprenyl-6-hydroxyphenol methylase/3-demethylubiquinol 3-O-methyltransferase UbiG [Caulobacterales bacterium]|nr:bifunctional 2-polyprenyl-6-hydroxyphenol methylase/3-demethylubiquinol 3-O-methyltransferase UbiG [Caulobacterales bacterium]